MRQQIGDPGRIIHISLASWNIANVLSVSEHQLKVTLQQMPDRYPIHPRRLHRYMGDSMRAQPLVELHQCRGGRRKSLHLVVQWLRNTADTRHHAVFMNVESGTT